MIAYVLWHRPADAVETVAYEDRLRAFHAAIRDDRPEGFLASIAFVINRTPWADEAGWYEDWYLVHDFASLGALRSVAHDDRFAAEHDSIAALTGRGLAGVYESEEQPRHFDAARVVWTSKPRSWTYAAFVSAMDTRFPKRSADRWMRQLLLAPAPEWAFAVAPGSSVETGLESAVISRRTLTPL